MKEKIKKILLACLVLVVSVSSVFLACYSNNKSKTDKSVERTTLRSNKAITTKEQLIGTWVFNDFKNGIDYSQNASGLPRSYVGFTCSGKEYSYIWGGFGRNYGSLYFNDINVYEDLTGEWTNQAYRTITITDVSNLTNDLDFIRFMNSNATKQGGTTPEPTPPTPTKKPIITNYYLTADIKTITYNADKDLYFDFTKNQISFTPQGTKLSSKPTPYPNSDISQLKLIDFNQFDKDISIKNPSDFIIPVVESGKSAKVFTYTYKDVDFNAYNAITYSLDTKVVESEKQIEVMKIYQLTTNDFRNQFVLNNLNSPKGIASGFIAIAMLPFTIIQSIFGDISLFGVQLKTLFIGILVIGLVVWVIQRVKIPEDTGSSGGGRGGKR